VKQDNGLFDTLAASLPTGLVDKQNAESVQKGSEKLSG
jgi:hypothetical protein